MSCTSRAPQSTSDISSAAELPQRTKAGLIKLRNRNTESPPIPNRIPKEFPHHRTRSTDHQPPTRQTEDNRKTPTPHSSPPSPPQPRHNPAPDCPTRRSRFNPTRPQIQVYSDPRSALPLPPSPLPPPREDGCLPPARPPTFLCPHATHPLPRSSALAARSISVRRAIELCSQPNRSPVCGARHASRTAHDVTSHHDRRHLPVCP
jgi:hypothetical protein